MTERKPLGMSWESWIDRQVREGMERGDFEDLPGTGKPIEIKHRNDELWWVKEKLARENVSHLPPTLALRKRVEDARTLIAGADDETVVRETLTELNAEIRKVNVLGGDGPPSTLMPLDIEAEVARWRSQITERGERGDRGEPQPDPASDTGLDERAEPASRRRRWLRWYWNPGA